MYGYFIGYLVAPETFASAGVIELVAGLPEAIKIAGKTVLAAPFAYHSWNGIRHLGWDLTKCTFSYVSRRTRALIASAVITLKGAYQSGYAVLAATAVSTVALVVM